MTTRKAEEIEPVFAQNLEKGDSATSIFHPFSLPTRSNDVLVGTIRGRLLLFALDTLEKSHVLHEDPTKRQIVALGIWPFGEPTDQPIVCWLHFRGSAIALFQLSSSDGELNCLPMRELPTAHYGFCRALADRNHNRMFIPDHEDLSSVLRIRFKNSGEVLLQLGEEFLSKSWPTKRKEATSTDEHPTMFKGMLMGIETLETATDHVILMAFEDSTIFLFNFRTKAVVDALKHPKHQEFLCWSVANAGEQTTLIFVSVVQQLFLLSHSAANNTGQEQLRVECVIRRCKSDNNCTSIACAYDSTSGECRMAAGLKDGTIQIYFLPSSSTTDAALNVRPCWSHPQLLQLSNFHANTIQSLTWILPSLPKDQQSTGISTPANYSQLSKQKRQSTKMSPAMTIWLCSGSADEKFAFFELPSSPSSNYLPISDSNR